MHNRNTFFVAAALGSATLVSSFVGCSSSSGNNNPGGQDSGTTVESGAVDTGTTPQDSSAPGETGAGDTGTTSSDSGVTGLNCNAGTAPTGTPILASGTASVQGILGNDTVLFYDSSATTLNSVPIAGGTPTDISAYDNSGLYISGNVALWSHKPTAATATAPTWGPLIASASGAASKTLSLAAYQSTIGGGYVDVSSDGSLVLYMTTSGGATSANIVVSAPDGTNPVTLVTGAVYDVDSSEGITLCSPNARFAGNTVIAAYCLANPTNGSSLSSTIAQYAVTGGAPTQTFTTAGFFGFTVDNYKTPTQIAYTTAGGQYVQSLTVGSTAKLIDPVGVGGADFTSDGLSIIYYEEETTDSGMAAGGLYRSTIASPSPTKIVAGLFGGTLALSSDDNWLVTYETAGTSFTDMYMVNTAASSSLVTLCPTETAAFFGDPFTVDDSQVLFFCNISTSGSGYVGDFDAEKLMAGATKTTVAPTNVWQANSVSGAKVLYNDHYIGGGPVYGYADIEAVDLSATPLAPTTVVSHADANYFLTADKTKLIYSFSSCPNAGAAGIYVIAAP